MHRPRPDSLVPAEPQPRRLQDAAIEAFATVDAPAGRLAEIRALCDEAFAGGFTDHDWDHSLGGLHVTVCHDRRPVAHAAVVARSVVVDDRTLRTGYIEGVATAPSEQRAGFGSLAVGEVTKLVRRDFELGALSTGAHRFFERLGWERWRGPTYVRCGDDVIRTAEEDDGVMVLRFGPSRAIDLASPLTCESRSGDDW